MALQLEAISHLEILQFQFHSQDPPPKISDRRLQVDYGVLILSFTFSHILLQLAEMWGPHSIEVAFAASHIVALGSNPVSTQTHLVVLV